MTTRCWLLTLVAFLVGCATTMPGGHTMPICELTDENIPRAQRGECDFDIDGDGVVTRYDNCLGTPNADQINTDSDGLGDTCDADDDNDTIQDVDDNCPLRVNPDQADTDHDGVGNRCDNCVGTPNTDQADTDHDGVGNQCDPAHQWQGLLRPYKETEDGDFGVILLATDSPPIMIPPDFGSVREDRLAWVFPVPYGKDEVFDHVLLKMEEGKLKTFALGNTGLCLTMAEAGATPPPNEGWFLANPADLRPASEKEATRPECAPYIRPAN